MSKINRLYFSESDFEETFHMETLHAAQTNCTTNDLPLNEITSMYAIIQDNSTTNNCNINNKLFPMEELLDLLPLNSDNIQSYSKQVDEFIKSVRDHIDCIEIPLNNKETCLKTRIVR